MAYRLIKNGIQSRCDEREAARNASISYRTLVKIGALPQPKTGKVASSARSQKGRISLIRHVLAEMRARGAILETTDERIKS